jgi:hypothetical protein
MLNFEKTPGINYKFTIVPYLSFIHIIWNTILILFVAWFFDNILSSNNGVKKPIWFLFTREFWGLGKSNYENIIKKYNSDNLNVSFYLTLEIRKYRK